MQKKSFLLFVLHCLSKLLVKKEKKEITKTLNFRAINNDFGYFTLNCFLKYFCSIFN